MTLPLDLTTAITGKALDGLFARQIATANNVANASSDTFVPTRITFESALRDAATSRSSEPVADVLARVAAVTPEALPALPNTLSGQSLDQEVTIASETTARYAMLIGMLDRTLQLQQLAIRGG